MNQETAIEMLRSLITVSLTVMTPVILAALVVGVAVSLLQAITSIQEPTLSFAPKLIAMRVEATKKSITRNGMKIRKPI